MEPSHTEADIRAVCQHVIDTMGESALTRPTVERILRTRAEAQGDKPTAGCHGRVSAVIKALKAEREAARESAQAAAPDSADDSLLPDGLDPTLEEVRRIYRRSMSDQARRSELGTQMRIKQVETQAAEHVAALRAEIEALERDAEVQARQLDEVEIALETSRASFTSVSATLEERTMALGALDRDTQARLSAAHARLEEATAARIASDERAHAAELARERTVSELTIALERIGRLEAELADRREAATDDEQKVREAERALDLAQGRLTALEEDCAWMRVRLERVADARQASEKRSGRTSASKEKTKSAGGR